MGGIIAPFRLSRQRQDCIGKAGAENEHDEKRLRGKHCGRQFGRAVPAQHDHIGGGNGDLGNLGTDQWQPKRQCRPDLGTPALLFALIHGRHSHKPLPKPAAPRIQLDAQTTLWPFEKMHVALN